MFDASCPDALWVADITYLPTWQGFLYLAVVLDAFSRRVVGWSMAGHLRTELILDALDMAISMRRPGEGLIHHSDRGTQGGNQPVVATPHRWRWFAMGVRERREAIQAMRGRVWSPGRPSTARREDRVRFWQAIARGASSEDAAGEVGLSPAVGARWFRHAGGMPPIRLAPVSERYLSFAEREELAIMHAQHLGVREIARRLGRSPSTVSRELRRNASTRSHTVTYRASTAQWHADRRASRPKVAKLAANDRLRAYVQERLAGMIARPDGELVLGPRVTWAGRRHGPRADRRWATAWSPEQILEPAAGRLPR